METLGFGLDPPGHETVNGDRSNEPALDAELYRHTPGFDKSRDLG